MIFSWFRKVPLLQMNQLIRRIEQIVGSSNRLVKWTLEQPSMNSNSSLMMNKKKDWIRHIEFITCNEKKLLVVTAFG